MRSNYLRNNHEAALSASTHALGWMFIANAIGVLLASLLLFPQLGLLFGECTYGRWVPLHLNINLYGWLSLPLIGCLFCVYRVQETVVECYARTIVWLWSLALVIGCITWLSGVSSGKVFLDWRGLSCYLFVSVMTGLWVFLAVAWWERRREDQYGLKLLGLLGLLPVPLLLYMATRPGIYPPVNPDTGGPTGASLLGSTLSILFLLLILPMMCRCKRRDSARPLTKLCWGAFVLEALLFMLMKQGNSSHRETQQILGLGSLMIWILLMPIYLKSWYWRAAVSGWRNATMAWLLLLILTGWLTFLPGWLDHLKFTNGLVAHSHLAMAGFCSSFLMLLMGQILPENISHILCQKREFFVWQSAVVVYVLLMWFSGWKEGNDAGFVMMQGEGLVQIYSLRLLCGLVMLWASFRWWNEILQQTNHES